MGHEQEKFFKALNEGRVILQAGRDDENEDTVFCMVGSTPVKYTETQFGPGDFQVVVIRPEDTVLRDEEGTE